MNDLQKFYEEIITAGYRKGLPIFEPQFCTCGMHDFNIKVVLTKGTVRIICPACAGLINEIKKEELSRQLDV